MKFPLVAPTPNKAGYYFSSAFFLFSFQVAIVLWKWLGKLFLRNAFLSVYQHYCLSNQVGNEYVSFDLTAGLCGFLSDNLFL